MRPWLYLGAVIVGFSLMALEDRSASERMVDSPEPAAVFNAGNIEPAEPAPPARSSAATTIKPADLGGMRTVSAEFGGRVHGVAR